MPNFGRAEAVGVLAPAPAVALEQLRPPRRVVSKHPLEEAHPPQPNRRAAVDERSSRPSSRKRLQAAREKLATWRAATSASTWKSVRQKFNDAGIEVALLATTCRTP
ncbi:MAG: hypothetical protein WDO73_12570 [Ignavibacteriota bacterium]